MSVQREINKYLFPIGTRVQLIPTPGFCKDAVEDVNFPTIVINHFGDKIGVHVFRTLPCDLSDESVTWLVAESEIKVLIETQYEFNFMKGY